MVTPEVHMIYSVFNLQILKANFFGRYTKDIISSYLQLSPVGMRTRESSNWNQVC